MTRPAWSACAVPFPCAAISCDADRPADEPCADVVAEETVGCGACETTVADEVVVAGDPIGLDVDMIAEPVGEPMAVVESVDPPPEVSSREDRLEEARPDQAAASVVVPDLRPAVDASAEDVQPTSAIEEPAPTLPAEPVAPVADPVVPPVTPEPNLFEEADQFDEAGQTDAPESTRADAVAEPAADVPPATEDREPSPESPVGSDAPAREPVEGSPANPLDEAERRSGEAARLWVDATGRHSAVGVLVEVSGDGRCVIDTGAGILEVRSADLRRRDRDYATQAAERLATRRGPGPAETAGR